MMLALLILSLVLLAIGGLWLLVLAFKENIWWGLGSLFVSPVLLVFGIIHWHKSKTPLLLYAAGSVLLAINIAQMHFSNNVVYAP
ncbi:hypothetical protein [Lysobacter antibioticus]|uniref:Transmembrane protein n=1 Tax=Lysobacter antibioticus TaxID=84531 RepID=A0A0S2F7Z9_LYSAN|nr:hypothetical protein [Lysobacter antibioticus]ALN79654.1 hypothetical protein LA76x_1497 [Lysobacter antibioticus]